MYYSFSEAFDVFHFTVFAHVQIYCIMTVIHCIHPLFETAIPSRIFTCLKEIYKWNLIPERTTGWFIQVLRIGDEVRAKERVRIKRLGTRFLKICTHRPVHY
jgi:hypothetical protein